MNRRRIGLAALVAGAGAFVRRRMVTSPEQSDASDGVEDHHRNNTVAHTSTSSDTFGNTANQLSSASDLSIAGVVAEPAAVDDVLVEAGVVAEPAAVDDVLVEAAVDELPVSAAALAEHEPPSDLVMKVVLPAMPQAGTTEIAEPIITIPSTDGEPQPIASQRVPPHTPPSTRPDMPPPWKPLGAPAPPITQSKPPSFLPAPEVDGPTNEGSTRGRGWQIFGGVLATLLIAAAVAGSVVRLPYYSFRPGSVYDTIERVEVPGDIAFIPNGEIGFVTVSQTADISPWQWLDAKLDRSVRIRHRDEVRGDQTADELRAADLRRMQVSKEAAVVLALEKLGFDLIITPIGIEVAQVFDCTAADGNLGTGDLIVGVNGADVRSGEDLIAQLATVEVGEPIEMLVERIDPNNPTQSMRTDLVGLTLGSADDACLPDDVRTDEPRPFIGIGTLPMFEEDFPIDIEVRTGRVGGPSAGLAFTLAIIDVLSEGELTNGLSIVATGTIDREGNVGPVGGIQQKVVAAERSGADVFIVPLCCDNFVSRTTGDAVDIPGNYEEALLYAEDIQVIGVDTLDEALAAIGELGGDVTQFLE